MSKGCGRGKKWDTTLAMQVALVNCLQNPNHPSLENLVLSTTVHLVDLRPVNKLEFVSCGPVEKNQSALSVSV